MSDACFVWAGCREDRFCARCCALGSWIWSLATAVCVSVCLCVYTRARLVDVCSLDGCMFFKSVCLEGVTIFIPKRQSKADKVSNYLLWKGKY